MDYCLPGGVHPRVVQRVRDASEDEVPPDGGKTQATKRSKISEDALDASRDKGAPTEEKPPSKEGDDAEVPADPDTAMPVDPGVSTDKAQVPINDSGANDDKKLPDSGDDSAPG